MSKTPRIALIAILATLLNPSAFLVEATCGQCYGSHACVSNTTYQMCFDGVPYKKYTFKCDTEKPACTSFGDICRTVETRPACGDTSKCDQCADGQKYACTSRNEFGFCQGGVLLTERATCPKDYTCSVSKGVAATPCVKACNPNSSDMCDRLKDNSGTDPNPGSTEPTPTDTTDSTSSTGTTAAPPFNANLFCQGIQKSGRFAIPNDTVCTSYNQCFYRARVWQGSITNCTAEKPYFNAESACGTIKPTGAGCI